MSHITAMIACCALGLLFAILRSMRDARKLRFPGKIPCTDCGDPEPLDSLSQCCGCGRLFCCGCVDPVDEHSGAVACEKCEVERRQKPEEILL